MGVVLPLFAILILNGAPALCDPASRADFARDIPILYYISSSIAELSS